MMSVSRGRLPVLLVVLFSTASVALPHEQEDKTPPRKPENLQVLPADISPLSLNRLMKRYEKDLGVSCSYCHVENRETGKLDYISDENAKKQVARIMISMLEDINNVHLAKTGGDARYAAAVTCGSCHRGRANPQSWEPGR